MQGEYAEFLAWRNQNTADLTRTTSNSTVSTNATAPNLIGPGRTIGLLIDGLRDYLDTLTITWVPKLKFGPKSAAQDVRSLLRHEETTIVERHAGYAHHFTVKEEEVLKMRCKRLLEYARCAFQISYPSIMAFNFLKASTPSQKLFLPTRSNRRDNKSHHRKPFCSGHTLSK